MVKEGVEERVEAAGPAEPAEAKPQVQKAAEAEAVVKEL